ncbi:phospholipase A2 inhibitor subunit gamma B-like [Thalassophryne amazonica]|uniref:phospholipase A2 inhibitor subunit gamma B-like n=1 Tax=Thalassophryne amazonica TaxID=390379 RepID=UPI001470AF59|nr:phospholipase A2 inhibitor subunit gamma B-like [Thalassophryne amazonica]
MILFLLLLLTICASADVLKCSTCNNINCTSTSTVSCGNGETMCLSASLILNFTADGTSVRRRVQKCTTLQVCSTSGVQNYEANMGYFSLLATAQCCGEDSCNQEPQPFPSSQGSAGSLQCFACKSLTSSVCNQMLQCQGAENSCMGASVRLTNIFHSAFGCVSSNLCTAFPFLSSFGGLEATITSGCCNTSLCNSGIPKSDAPSSATTTSGPTTTGSGNHAYCVSLCPLHLLLGLILFAAF